MPSNKPPPSTRKQKVLTALQGDDEFSVFSVEPEHRKPLVELEADGKDAKGKPQNTAGSRSIVRLLRKVFSE